MNAGLSTFDDFMKADITGRRSSSCEGRIVKTLALFSNSDADGDIGQERDCLGVNLGAELLEGGCCAVGIDKANHGDRVRVGKRLLEVGSGARRRAMIVEDPDTHLTVKDATRRVDAVLLGDRQPLDGGCVARIVADVAARADEHGNLERRQRQADAHLGARGSTYEHRDAEHGKGRPCRQKSSAKPVRSPSQTRSAGAGTSDVCHVPLVSTRTLAHLESPMRALLGLPRKGGQDQIMYGGWRTGSSNRAGGFHARPPR